MGRKKTSERSGPRSLNRLKLLTKKKPASVYDLKLSCFLCILKFNQVGIIEKQKRLNSYKTAIHTAKLELEIAKLKASRPYSQETKMTIENLEMTIKMNENKLCLEKQNSNEHN